jgi:hypothetical protein
LQNQEVTSHHCRITTEKAFFFIYLLRISGLQFIFSASDILVRKYSYTYEKTEIKTKNVNCFLTLYFGLKPFSFGHKYASTHPLAMAIFISCRQSNLWSRNGYHSRWRSLCEPCSPHHPHCWVDPLSTSHSPRQNHPSTPTFPMQEKASSSADFETESDETGALFLISLFLMIIFPNGQSS